MRCIFKGNTYKSAKALIPMAYSGAGHPLGLWSNLAHIYDVSAALRAGLLPHKEKP